MPIKHARIISFKHLIIITKRTNKTINNHLSLK